MLKDKFTPYLKNALQVNQLSIRWRNRIFI